MSDSKPKPSRVNIGDHMPRGIVPTGREKAHIPRAPAPKSPATNPTPAPKK